MKKIIAIVLICVSCMVLLCACKPADEMGDMVETMISTILSTENQNKTENSADNGENGTINDHDGYIGNEGSESSRSDTEKWSTTVSDPVVNDSVM